MTFWKAEQIAAARSDSLLSVNRPSSRWKVMIAACLMISSLGAGPSSWAYERPNFKAGFNLFAPTRDVQVGREAAQEVDKQLVLLKDSDVLRYLNKLGRSLAQFAPNQKGFDYPWQFKVVNSMEINAFALPGGIIYVNRGVIVAAQNEAEIAGVIAHEEGHVVMRHGTQRASEEMLAQFPLAIIEGLLGQSSGLASQITRLGLEIGVPVAFLKNSRAMEAQADQVGTYILYQAGYYPYAMANFFEIIQKKYPQQTIQFFSDHPNPGNRIEAVDREIPQLGPKKEWKTDSPEFEAIKQRLESLGLPPRPRQTAGGQTSPAGPPPAASDRWVKYTSQGFSISYPDNWTAEASDQGVTFAPPGGRIVASDGAEAQAYGASISLYQPQNGSANWGLVQATQQLVDALRKSNPNLRVLSQKGFNLHGQAALSTWFENDSPLGGQKEEDRLVTLRQSSSLLALIFVAPKSALPTYSSIFDRMLESLEIR